MPHARRWASHLPGTIVALLDARMGEVYTGAFERHEGDAVACSAEAVGDPAAVELDGGAMDWQGVGTGFAAVDGALRQRLAGRLLGVDAAALPRAGDVARLAVLACARGEAVAPERVEPAYLRNNVALTIAEQQALRQARK